MRTKLRIQINALGIDRNGDIIITGHPIGLKLGQQVADYKNVHSPGKVVRIPAAQIGDKFYGRGSGRVAKPVVQTLFYDNTGVADCACTSVLIDNYLYVSGLFTQGLIKCPIPLD